MAIYDISVEISALMPIWPNDPPFSRDENKISTITVSTANFGLHTGTHIDAPYHFIPGGKTIDQYPPDRFLGTCCVVEITNQSITLHDLKKLNLTGVKRIIFKTANSSLQLQESSFFADFVALDPEAADYIVKIGIELVGIDYLSIQSYHAEDNYVHETLLKNDVLILEGLNLLMVPEGNYQLVACPLRIKGAEASPVRALLISSEDKSHVNVTAE